jgi:hypothetical protein
VRSASPIASFPQEVFRSGDSRFAERVFCSDHFLLFVSPFAFNRFGAELLLKIFHNPLESENGFSLTHRATFAISWIDWILEESNGFFQAQNVSCVVFVYRIRDFWTGCAFGCARAWRARGKLTVLLESLFPPFLKQAQEG